jgi:putative aldouronate transport system permease protein
VCKTLLGLSDNYAALIVPLLFSPFNVIVMRTFFQTTVPRELIEASTIDGAGEYRTLLQIVLPVVKPGIATIALLNALAFWNEWFLSLLYITKNMDVIPLQYLLMRMQRNADFLAKNSAMLGADAAQAARNLPSQSLKMALVVFIVVPIACAYPFFQRYVVAGLTVGSVKG